MIRVHLDTDLGGDPDDACALAMLLGWPGVEITGITTVADADGLRAAYVRHLLHLGGRGDIPVAAGAGASLTTGRIAEPYSDDVRFWPPALEPLLASAGAAFDMLTAAMEAGTTIVAIGPQTNLALMELIRPGSLDGVSVTVMGGWLDPPIAGLPPWGPEMDWNVQWDVRAAEIVARAANLTLVTLPVTLHVHLRAAHLPRLRASGPLGQLLAHQSEAHAEIEQMAALGYAHAGLPDDLLNFHYDPVTCAVAVGWPGVTVEELHLLPVIEEGLLRFTGDPTGRLTNVVTSVDGSAFAERWLAAVNAAEQEK